MASGGEIARDALAAFVVELFGVEGEAEDERVFVGPPEANVRAFVSVQAPFAGTPLADRRSLLRSLAPEAFFEMSYPERQAFLRQRIDESESSNQSMTFTDFPSILLTLSWG